MRDRRLVYVILAAVALVVLFLVLRPGSDEETSPTTTPTAEPAPTESEPETGTTSTAPTTTSTAAPAAATQWRIDARDEQLDRLTVPNNTNLRVVVIADVTDEVHVHGYDLMAEVAPGAPAVIAFTANIPGRFEIELEERGREIAQLTVEP